MSSFKHRGHTRKFALEAQVRDSEVLDLSANINALGLPEWLRAATRSALNGVIHYPDPESSGLKSAVARRFRFDADRSHAGLSTGCGFDGDPPLWEKTVSGTI